MSDELNVLRVAEELQAARHNVESTVVMLRTQLNAIEAEVSATLGELEKHGTGADMSRLVDIEDRASQVSKLRSRLARQREHLTQALTFVKLVQTTL